MTEQIVFYGKGGVGKSTLISNISAALVEAGFKVLQIGCDPKADSCTTLTSGFQIPTVCDQLSHHDAISTETAISRGFKGIHCMELGDPGIPGEPAGRPIAEALRAISESGIFEELKPDYVLYDISGEAARYSFQATFQQFPIKRVFVVTTADFVSLSAANSILTMLDTFGEANIPVPVGGLIPNSIASSFEESFIADFAKYTGTHVLGRIPRSLMVRQCELYGKTVIEASPLSNQAYFYRRIANQIVDETRTLSIKSPPRPMSRERLRIWAHEWADRLFALENGLVTDGAAI
jgi:nitrogenase iron protein NifH